MKSYYGTLSGSHGSSFRIRQIKSPEVPPSEKITMTSYSPCNETSLSRKPCIPDEKLILNIISKSMVALSKSVMKNRVQYHLAEKSRWRHNRLAMKPRYLGKYASQMKCYNGTLWRSHGRSFRIRHKKSPEEPFSGEITMTSYPSCNKTSLSRKPCIPYEKLIWNTVRKSWSLFQYPSWKIAWSAPRWRNHDDVISYL